MWFLGLAALIYGIGGLINGIQLRNSSSGGTAMIIGGVLSIIFAIILLSSPYGAFITIVKTLGVITLIGGIILGYFAFKLKPKD